VPFRRQEHSHTCGPACLRIVLEFYGTILTESALEAQCRTTLLGTGRTELAQGAIALGFGAHLVERFTYDEVSNCLSQGQPIIAVIDASVLYPGIAGFAHGVLIIGLEEGVVVYHDPESAAAVEVPWERFAAAWDRRERKGVIVWKP
jgi:ABC-type bacteriocin/lantibiotic exporter with double-glycine peptidase domain